MVNLAPESLAVAGAGLPHNNMQPYLTMHFCIAMQGIFPQRW
jgi:microcystin-dependent protein